MRLQVTLMSIVIPFHGHLIESRCINSSSTAADELMKSIQSWLCLSCCGRENCGRLELLGDFVQLMRLNRFRKYVFNSITQLEWRADGRKTLIKARSLSTKLSCCWSGAKLNSSQAAKQGAKHQFNWYLGTECNYESSWLIVSST